MPSRLTVQNFGRACRTALLWLVRAEARTLRLRGTDSLLRWLYHPDRRASDYLDFVGPYDDSLVQTDTRSFLEWWVYAYGGYATGSMQLLRRLVHPGSVVLDVGANIGLFTLPLARAAGETGVVHAFEPHPRLRARLVGNVALNSLRNVTVSGLALGSRRCQATLWGSTTANQGRGSLQPGPGLDEEFTCQVDTLDWYVEAAALPRIDVIKIDTEGAELSVLVGGGAALQTFKPVLYLEAAPELLAKFGATEGDVADFLRGLGYQLWGDASNGKSPHLVPLADGMSESVSPRNWLAVHPESVARTDLARADRRSGDSLGVDAEP